MAECIVCGEKIEDGKQYCSVCAPENHRKVDLQESTDDVALDNGQEQENKVEIKKDSVILDEEIKESNSAEDAQEDNG